MSLIHCSFKEKILWSGVDYEFANGLSLKNIKKKKTTTLKF